MTSEAPSSISPAEAALALEAAPAPPVSSAQAQSPQAAAAAAALSSDGRRRGGGRLRDAIWLETTILADKTVLCNLCHAAIHRYGCAKVERVRAHFQFRCLSDSALAVLSRATAANPHSSHSSTSGGKKPKKQVVKRNSSATGAAEDPLVNVAPTVAAVRPKTTATSAATARRAAEQRTAAKMTLFKRKVAQWVFATAQPLETVENELLAGALRVLRADAQLPTRAELEGELLESESAAAAAAVDKRLLAKTCCLALENWTDADGGAHTNFVALCENAPHFIEEATPALALQEPSGVQLAAEAIERVLAKHRKSLFCAVVTPETAMLSQASRERIQRQFPHCVFFYGCARHALRQLVTDVCSILPWLVRTHNAVLEMLRVFQRNPKLRAQLQSVPWLNERLASAGADGSAAAAEFFSSNDFVALLEAVLATEKDLYAAVSRRDFVDADAAAERETLTRVQDFVLSETFAQDLVRATNVVRPLQQQLQRVEGDTTSLAHVYHSFQELADTYASMDCVSRKEKALIVACVGDRLESIYGDVLGVAYTLDPTHLGERLDPERSQRVENFITAYCSGTTAHDPAMILAQLESFRAMARELKECNSTYWKLLKLGEVRAFDFWGERRQFPQLQQLAWAVFSLPSTSTAPARAFGTQCQLLHSRFGAVLSPEKLQQLALVYCNAKTPDAPPLSPLELVTDATEEESEVVTPVL